MGKAKANQVQVRARVTLSEDGKVYQPAREERDASGNNRKVPADAFTTDEDRAAALGDSVELIGPVETAK